MFIAVKMARLQHFTKRVKSAQKVATAVGPQMRCCQPNARCDRRLRLHWWRYPRCGALFFAAHRDVRHM